MKINVRSSNNFIFYKRYKQLFTRKELKNLARYRSENNFVELSKYVRRSSTATKNFDFLISLSVLRNYLHSLTKLFSDPYLAKFLDYSVKSFFP